KEILVDQKIFLLRSDGGEDFLHAGTAEEFQDADGLLRQRFHRLQERRLFVERFAGPADERGWDDQGGAIGVFENKRGAGGVPSGVAAGFKRGANATGRERRRVRLALDELLTAELGDRLAVGSRRQEAVVLLGGQAGHRLKDVGEVSRA